MTTFLRISGRDPLVARDSRPFGAGQGNRMRSSGWLYPSVVAGSFRTTIAKAVMTAEQDFDVALQNELLTIAVAGVLPLVDGGLLLPAPSDCVLGEKGSVFRAKPHRTLEEEGNDWPADGLRPVVIDAEDDFKPEMGPAFWPMSRYAEWLADKTFDPRSEGFHGAAVPDVRDHVSLDAETGAAEEGLLFTTAGIGSLALPRFGRTPEEAKPTGPPRFPDVFAEMELAARVDNIPEWARGKLATLSTWHPLGGERRLVHWGTSDDAKVWECPESVRNALAEANLEKVTMTLATPAIFRDGWKPGWLNEQLTGSPFKGGPRLSLVGVCIQRWRAVSGWSYKDRGPKAIRRMVPAGGVYFFELLDKGRGAEFEKHWLCSVSDGVQDQRDGFGLAVWGTW
jgi:CRISPR-associated protein Cmr3